MLNTRLGLRQAITVEEVKPKINVFWQSQTKNAQQPRSKSNKTQRNANQSNRKRKAWS